MNAISSPVWERTYDELTTRLYADSATLGGAAADDLARIIQRAVRARGEASVIVATGNSQLHLMEALRRRVDVPWSRVRIFHMDEYCGMSDDHPASFRLYIRRNLTDHVHPLAFHGLAGDAPDLALEMGRYRALLRRYPADACVMGIGENGHLAFNDPPADFDTAAVVHIVTLDLACRRQQVGEGHFRTIEDVPEQAMTLTVPALMAPPHLLVVVPEQRKAEAVRTTLEGPVTPGCQASILRRQRHAMLYLDPGSASLLGAVHP